MSSISKNKRDFLSITQKLSDVCFLDWQMARFGSPVLDLYHIIFTSTDQALRAKEYHNLLHHYHRTLTRAIKRLGSPADLFSRRDFDEHLQKFGSYAVMFAMIMTLLVLADSADLVDLDALCDNGPQDQKAQFVNELSPHAQVVYNQRIRDLVSDMYDLGLYAKKTQ